MKQIRVTVWNEYIHEREMAEVAAVYPKGIHQTIADFLNEQEDLAASTATLDMPEHGLTQEVLDTTDVLIWWGHCAHDRVSDEVVERVHRRVLEGMGLIVLHSGHASKIFHKVCGTCTLNLKWRESGDKEILWCVNPGHPIMEGLGDHIILEHEETYGEHFDIPQPDELVLIGWYEGGEVFRSGCCWTRGRGHVFYFQPGHETLPTYHQKGIQQVITNAVRWAAPVNGPKAVYGHYPDPIIQK